MLEAYLFINNEINGSGHHYKIVRCEDFFLVNINELLVGNSWTFGRVIVLLFHVLHAGDFGY